MEQIYVCMLEDFNGHKIPAFEINHDELKNLVSVLPEIKRKIAPGIDIGHVKDLRRLKVNPTPAKEKLPRLPRGAKQTMILETILKTGYPPKGRLFYRQSLEDIRSRELIKKSTDPSKRYELTEKGLFILDVHRHWRGSYSNKIIADYLRENGEWVDQKTLAEVSKLHVHTILRVAKDLHEMGVIEVQYGRCTRAPSIQLVKWKGNCGYNSRASISHNVDYANKSEEAKA